MESPEEVRSWISNYYGNVLSDSCDLKTNACKASGKPPKWIRKALANISEECTRKFYGCGFPFPDGLEGSTVIDLGCGAGRDVYVLSQLVGPTGHVYGVDMTVELLDIARKTQDWHMERFFGNANKPNVSFHQGLIENLSFLQDASVDVAISNGVVNLCPNKELVLAEVHRILKEGGEFYFSDIFVDRRNSNGVKFDPVLHSECLGGAPYVKDFISMAKEAGFKDPLILTKAPITIKSDEVKAKVGAAKFTSMTFRLIKLASLEHSREDYGQSATYCGGLESSPSLFSLDENHAFELERPERVSANIAAMLAETRYAKHFKVVGGKDTHFGAFENNSTMAALQYKKE